MCFPEDLSLLSSRKCSLCLTRAELSITVGTEYPDSIHEYKLSTLGWSSCYNFSKTGNPDLRLYLDREDRACWLATTASSMKWLWLVWFSALLAEPRELMHWALPCPAEPLTCQRLLDFSYRQHQNFLIKSINSHVIPTRQTVFPICSSLSDLWVFIKPLDLFVLNSSTAFLVQCLLMLSEQSSGFFPFSTLPSTTGKNLNWKAVSAALFFMSCPS